jgi:hypothetical protein
MTKMTDALDACPQCGSQKRTLQLSYFSNQALKLGPTICHHLWHDGKDSVPEPGAPTPTDAQHDSVRQQAEEIARLTRELASANERADRWSTVRLRRLLALSANTIAELKAELERLRPSANAPDISTPPKI